MSASVEKRPESASPGRALCLTSYVPLDPATYVAGTYQRLKAMLAALARSNELDLVFFVEPVQVSLVPADLRERIEREWAVSVARLELVPMSLWRERSSRLFAGYLMPAASVFRQESFGRAAGPAQLAVVLEALGRGPDLVFAHRLTGMAPLLRLGLRRGQLPPVIFDLDDLEHLAIRRTIREPPYWRSKQLLSLRVPSLMLAERRAAQLAEATIVCSEADRQRLRRATGAPRIEVVPNAVELPPVPAPCPEPTLLFLGTLSYAPNAGAADYLAGEIWPLIRSRVPQARLVIAGKGAEGLAHHARPPQGVSYAGFVADLGRLYAETAVVCCPIRSGSGTRIKILEAGAYARPVVSTTIGAEGIDLRDSETALLRDTTESFAEACVELLQDPGRAARIGAAARRLVESRYSREAMMEEVQRLAEVAIRGR